MVNLHGLAAFCAASLLMSVIPGPGVLFVVGRALAHGRRIALASVLGNALGGYALVIVVALGVGSVVERSALVFTLVKLAGAGYLVFLGVRALRAARRTRSAAPEGDFGGRGAVAEETAASRRRAPVRERRAVWEGFVVGVTNPKSLVLLTAVLPQFVDRAAGHVPVQMLLFGLAGAVLALASDSAWGLAASAARTWLGRSPRRLAVLGGAGGLAMIGLGVGVAVTGRRDYALG